ncbi:MAG: hypothetical protein IKG87_07785 [Clostridia bacterium]|nr:hypothetical protein [Clostridia bacterium]
MKSRKAYRDAEKYRQYRNGYNNRYYRRTQFCARSKMPWSEEEEKLAMEHKHTDTEIAKMIGRSVRAIQLKRNKIRTEEGENDRSAVDHCNLPKDGFCHL